MDGKGEKAARKKGGRKGEEKERKEKGKKKKLYCVVGARLINET